MTGTSKLSSNEMLIRASCQEGSHLLNITSSELLTALLEEDYTLEDAKRILDIFQSLCVEEAVFYAFAHDEKSAP